VGEAQYEGGQQVGLGGTVQDLDLGAVKTKKQPGGVGDKIETGYVL